MRGSLSLPLSLSLSLSLILSLHLSISVSVPLECSCEGCPTSVPYVIPRVFAFLCQPIFTGCKRADSPPQPSSCQRASLLGESPPPFHPNHSATQPLQPQRKIEEEPVKLECQTSVRIAVKVSGTGQRSPLLHFGTFLWNALKKRCSDS